MMIKRRITQLAFCILASSAYADESLAKSDAVRSGVGVALNEVRGELFIVSILAGSPADKSGRIHKGDRLVAVQTDGKRIALSGKTIGEAARIIRGPAGTDLVLALMTHDRDTERNVALTRASLPEEWISASSVRSLVGKSAPELVLSTLDGESTTKLSAYRGKVVVLQFWASWCTTGYAPVTKMQDVLHRNKDWNGRVEMIAVSVDADLANAANTVAKQGWDLTRHLAASFDNPIEFGMPVVPITIVIATDGTIVTMAGSQAIDVEAEVKTLLATKPPQQKPVEP